MLLALAASTPVTFTWGAPQTFDTALPVAKGEFVFREQLMYAEATDDPTAADRDVQVFGAVSALGFGVTPRVALFAVLPYLDKQLEVTTGPARRATHGASGIGDLRLFARYTVVQNDGPGRTFRIAPVFGFEVPTGGDDERDRLGVLPQPLQPGSGSLDPFAGVVLTYQTLTYQVDAQFGYEHNAEANGFEFGDVLRLDASLQYRLWPRELSAGVPGFVYAVIEANLAERDANTLNGVEDPNSGGTTFHLSPGLRYVTKRWIVEGIVQIPVTQELGGDALEEDFTVRVGFRFNF